jgi:hypothetical protein
LQERKGTGENMGLPVLFYWLVAYGVFGIVLALAGFNWWLGGLFGPFFKVKASRGKKILVRVRNPVQDYFRAGEVIENHLIFKDREKDTRRIPMEYGVVSRAATIFWCEVDDEKNCFFKREDAKAVQTYDAKKTDSLLVRALYKPALEDNFTKAILLLVIVGLLFTIVVGVLVYRATQRIDAVQVSLDALRSTATIVKNNSTVI